MEVDRSITADRPIDVIERLVVTHGAPEHLRMDNGPELLSWALRDWCRFTGTRTICIEPGSPGRTVSSSRSTAEHGISSSTS